jgi:hypothetical protein
MGELLGDLRPLIILLAALAGTAVALLLGYVLDALSIAGDGKGLIARVIILGVVCYLGSGFIAGYWANWRGAAQGAFAAMLGGIVNSVYTLAVSGKELVTAFGPEVIAVAFGFGLIIVTITGALGGVIGERLRA